MLTYIKERRLLVQNIAFFALIFLAAPQLAHAQEVQDILRMFGTVFNRAMPLFIGIALVVFMYGVVSFILAAGNPAKREIGRSFMIWGIFALFLMVSTWGIVAVFQGIFQTTDTDPMDFPIVDLGAGGGGPSGPPPPNTPP